MWASLTSVSNSERGRPLPSISPPSSSDERNSLSESDMEHPPKKKCISGISSSEAHLSARQSKMAQREWIVFDFTNERPNSLMPVPSSWIVDGYQKEVKEKVFCYRPPQGSTDEKRIKMLIKGHSEPDKSEWAMLPGRIKGRHFKTLKEASSYIHVHAKVGTVSTCTDGECNGAATSAEFERLAAQVKNNNLAKNKKEPGTRTVKTTYPCKYLNPTPSTSSTTDDPCKILNPTPSTSSGTMPSSSGPSRSSSHGLAHTKVKDVDVTYIFEKLRGEMKKNRALQVQEFNKLQVEIQELKREVADMKQELKRTPKNPPDYIQSAIENPFDKLNGFGFKAKSLQELLQREKQFSAGEDHIDGKSKKKRSTLLRVLLELAPKPKKNSNIFVLDVIRSTMQRLADDSVWQYVSAFGRSGTKKLSMSKQMPAIMDIVLLTAVKTLPVDTKEASTALSNYLKATATRASAKKYKLKHGNVTHQQLDNSVYNETASLIGHRVIHHLSTDESESD